MKFFVYNLRTYDEQPFFDQFARQYGCSYGYTGDYPDTNHILSLKGQGYKGVSIIPGPMGRDKLAAFREAGITCLSTRSIGYEHIDLNSAAEFGIRCSHVSYSPDSVANYAIMLMLMCCRKAKQILFQTAVQDFSLQGRMGREISQCTVGIIGTGHIGRRVIEHLQGFGCRIIACSAHRSRALPGSASYVDMEQLLQESDIVSLHTSATAEKYHLINRETLQQMKPGAILINTARGSLVDTAALTEALLSGQVSAAGLDVVEGETSTVYKDLRGQVLSPEQLPPLAHFPNVILTPHSAFYTEQAVSEQIESVFRSFRNFENGQPDELELHA